MRFFWWVALVFFSGACLMTGCGRQKVPSDLSSSDKQAFDSAPAEIKQVWIKGLEAVNTNDYAMAQNLFYSLLSQDLSPAQKQAVTKETTIVMDRLYSGVEKGDPTALKAMEEMRRNPPNRQPR
jgi:hypothetical protein